MKLIDAGYTGAHQYSFKAGEKALITGVKMCLPDGGGEWRAVFEIGYKNGECDTVPIFDGWKPDERAVKYEISKWYEATPQELEAERVARLMCEATYGIGMVDAEINRSEMPVIGKKYLLPPRWGRIKLWQEFYQAALAVLKDRERK